MDFHINDDERAKALKLCSDNLGGIWAEVTLNQVIISRVRYGLIFIISDWLLSLDTRWTKSLNHLLNLSQMLKTSGGLTNMIYKCALQDHVKTLRDEPRVALLRIYGESHCDINVQLEVFNQLAHAKLEPNPCSAFQEGRFEEY